MKPLLTAAILLASFAWLSWHAVGWMSEFGF